MPFRNGERTEIPERLIFIVSGMMHVLKIVYVCGSGMDGFEPFQKRTLSRVPECAEISCSGTYYFKAFRNGKKRFWF